eukprot:gnl/MRDRNA2_/MRDRNA2_59039_c0_seq1.p1 gnl/MRDRNA2_/MRDRNA2_59039_c0~~gnl/MRDRNA2_/MRDRNA2_59039_c0_seq1.p1  ORF type:complete len:240 (+),score=47.17 gnl/MRDRNA2_/MRDRNA2_59039_c0_seq1:52-720(+)
MSDTQFYVAVRICNNEAEWRAAREEFKQSDGLQARQQFYLKWAHHFGWQIATRWEDVHLIHTEPFIFGKSEHQVEAVVTADKQFLLADTGDLYKNKEYPSCGITAFKTPGNFIVTPILQKWLDEQVIEGLVAHGFKSAAMDIEFFRVDCDEERYELVEVNPRYSFMGFFKMISHLGHGHKDEQSRVHEVRNLLNRSLLALGAPPATLPVRDNPGWCKLAAFV